MSDRVSDGLVAELQKKIGDGTPRGYAWGMFADILLMAVQLASTEEEVALANETLVAAIHNADERAVSQLEFQVQLAQLQEYLNRNSDSDETS